MSYQKLRALMKGIAPPEEVSMKNCNVVIDGKTFFKDSYKNSGCHSLLGGEYDRYADYIRHLFKPFIENNITCFVIFNGCMDANVDKRIQIHQNIINRVDAINCKDDNAYCEPILAKDVIKETLVELGIKYYVTKNDHRQLMLSVASHFKCPIITKNYEISLLYNSCINPKSLTYDVDEKKLTCKMFRSIASSKSFRIKHCLLPLFFTLMDENGVCFKKLIVIVNTLRPKNLLRKVLSWMRGQVDYLEDVLASIQEILTTEEWQEFKKTYEENIELCKHRGDPSVLQYFSEQNDPQLFRIGVENGSVAVPYITLFEKDIFSGSWVIFDKDQEDAMIPALDIVFYVKLLLDNREEYTVTFVGRQGIQSQAWEISKTLENWCPKINSDLFVTILCHLLPGFDIKLLEQSPKESWILIATLLYYYQKKMDMNFICCILLSYVMLEPVASKVGVIKRSHFMCLDKAKTEEDKTETDELKREDCNAAVESMMDFFYVKKLKDIDRKFLHNFAEFQHCLQHMNYVNNIFGRKMPFTIYNKTLNATFVYNMYMKLKEKRSAVKYFAKRPKNSTVLTCFEKLKNVFDACMEAIGLGLEDRMNNLQIVK